MRTRAGVAITALLCGIAGGLLGNSGCGKNVTASTATVRGSVTFQGRPLSGGLIVFTPDREKGNAGRAASATIGSDGWYKLTPEAQEGIIPGWYQVAIAEPATAYLEDLNSPRFPAALRRPDRSGLNREIQSGQENLFHFAVEVPE